MTISINEYDRKGLIKHIHSRFLLDWAGIHGANHWVRVLYHAKHIGLSRQADLLVVELFAFLHDACRMNDDIDPYHGERGAELALELNGNFYDLHPRQLDLLCRAIKLHSSGMVSNEVTIQTCWDGDRLDLGRIGVRASPKFLSKEGVRYIESAYKMSNPHWADGLD